MDFRIVPAQRAQVHILFYRPGPDDPFLNKLVAFADPPYSHVEIAFADKWGEDPWERELWGSSIYQGETVFFKPKTYSRDGYFVISLDISFQQMHRMRAFCKTQADNTVLFSKYAMYAAYFPYFQLVNTDGTFCSKHVTSALKHSGLHHVQHLNPSLVTPSKLYRVLSTASPIVQALPSKMAMRDAKIKCTAKMVEALLL